MQPKSERKHPLGFTHQLNSLIILPLRVAIQNIMPINLNPAWAKLHKLHHYQRQTPDNHHHDITHLQAEDVWPHHPRRFPTPPCNQHPTIQPKHVPQAPITSLESAPCCPGPSTPSAPAATAAATPFPDTPPFATQPRLRRSPRSPLPLTNCTTPRYTSSSLLAG